MQNMSDTNTTTKSKTGKTLIKQSTHILKQTRQQIKTCKKGKAQIQQTKA